MCTTYDEVVIGVTASKAHLIGTSFFIYATFSGTQGLKEGLPDYINNGTYTLHEGTLAQ